MGGREGVSSKVGSSCFWWNA